MKKFISILTISLILVPVSIIAKYKTVKLRFIETSDVHGIFFPTDIATGKPQEGSMARISSYLKAQRDTFGSRVILMDNGDILQGQPINEYWNNVNTGDENIASKITNYLRYDAQAFGNHEIATGHACYDKWIHELRCPVLGANVIYLATNKPYTQPYTIIERGGIKVAVLGMLTPATRNKVKGDMWSGMQFNDLVYTAGKWIEEIREKEHPDLIVGLFHQGLKGGDRYVKNDEDAVQEVARRVKGLDIIFYGHDHQAYCGWIKNESDESDDNPFYFQKKDGSITHPSNADSTLVINPGSKARRVAQADVVFAVEKGKVLGKVISGKLVPVTDQPVDEDFMKHFDADIRKYETYASQKK